MEISLHCSSWSTKFGSNHIGGIGEAIYLGGGKSVSGVVRVCVCLWAHLSCRGMSKRTRTPREATRSLPIGDHREREREILLTLPCAEPNIHWHTPTHTHACVQCINVTKRDKSHFHLGTEKHRSSKDACIYSKWRRLGQGIVPGQPGWLLLPLQSFSISLAHFKWILRLRHVLPQVVTKTSAWTSCCNALTYMLAVRRLTSRFVQKFLESEEPLGNKLLDPLMTEIWQILTNDSLVYHYSDTMYGLWQVCPHHVSFQLKQQTGEVLGSSTFDLQFNARIGD